MVLSKIDCLDVEKYTNADTEDRELIYMVMQAAKGYIYNYTGYTPEEADKIPELGIAFMCLCADMLDSRTASVSAAKNNPIVSTVLDMHRVNLIAVGGDKND